MRDTFVLEYESLYNNMMKALIKPWSNLKVQTFSAVLGKVELANISRRGALDRVILKSDPWRFQTYWPPSITQAQQHRNKKNKV